MDKIKLRGETEANWILYDPVLAERETVLTLDGSGIPTGIKAGDGIHKWSELAYLGGFSNAESDPLFTDWLSTFVATAAKTYLSLTDTADSRAGKAKHVVGVNDAETADEYIPTKIAQLTDNSDFPATYVGQALKLLQCNAGENGTQWYILPSSFPASDVYAWAKAATKPAYGWGEITGKPTQEIELNQEWKLGNNLYIENVFTGSDLTQVNYWSSSAKTLKLFTKDITYTGGNPTSIVLKDEITGKLLTTTIVYSGSEVSNVTKVVS